MCQQIHESPNSNLLVCLLWKAKVKGLKLHKLTVRTVGAWGWAKGGLVPQLFDHQCFLLLKIVKGNWRMLSFKN